MRSCCGHDMERVEEDVTGDGVRWFCLACQICDHVEWVRGFDFVAQPDLFGGVLMPRTVDRVARAGAYS